MPGTGLVGGLLTAVPEHLIDLGGGHGDRRRGDDQLDRVHRAGPDLDLLGRTVLDQLAALDPLRPGRARTPGPDRAAARAERGCRRTSSARRGPRSARPPRGARSAAAICARLRNGTAARRRRAVGEALPPRRASGRARTAEPPASSTQRGERPAEPSARCSPRSRSDAANSPISSCSGSWPSHVASSAGSISAARPRVHGP